MPNLEWFHEARYGMFIHWGPYAQAARGEWAANRERIPRDEYVEKCVLPWKAQDYDPRAWVALAKEAGMKYVVLTTRHHDGFALFDSAADDFNAAKMGPGRDLVAPFAEAVREAGLRLGFYYSPAAWYHPDYPGAFFRDWPGEEDWRTPEHRRRFIEYYRAQLRELMTRYGRVDVLWYDGCIPRDIDGAAANGEVRALQPDILITERNGEPWDIQICEQAIKPAGAGVAWEACMTLNGNWGYHAGDHDWKSPKAVIEMLLTTAAGAGNLLLNVGPRGDGTIPPESARILREAGTWLARNDEAIRNSGRSPFTWSTSAIVTVKGSRVYLHLKHDPGGSFCWAELKNKVLGARFLAGGEAVAFRQEGARLFLGPLRSPLPDAPIATIELEVEGEPEAVTEQTSFWIAG